MFQDAASNGFWYLVGDGPEAVMPKTLRFSHQNAIAKAVAIDRAFPAARCSLVCTSASFMCTGSFLWR
jgi:hypothetical protein